MIIPDLVSKWARKTPERTALIASKSRFTWRDLDLAVNRFANGLLTLGLKKRDRVALVMDNYHAAYCVIAYLGTQRAGGVVVPIISRLAPRELNYILDHSEAKFVVVQENLAENIRQIKSSTPFLSNYIVVGKQKEGDEILWEQVQGSEESPNVRVSVDDWATFLYTSGTTGLPKGTMHTHFTQLHMAIRAQSFGLLNSDVYETPIPFYTSTGCSTYFLPALYAGCTMIYDSAFDVEMCLDTIATERTTVFFGVPAMFIFMLQHPKLHSYDVSSLRLFYYGGSIMPYEIIKRINTEFPNVKLYNLYGLTEAGPGGTMLEPEYALTKQGSVGKPDLDPFTEIKLVDNEGNEVKPGEVGEILIKTPSAMIGYYKQPELTAETVKEGFICTGDLGQMDEEGFLYIVDRKKDMIIRGGFNIYPAEIENVLIEHPDIVEVAVIGVPHTALGEDIKAFVVKKKDSNITENQVVEFCRGKIADYKVPRKVQFIDALPRNPMGKLLKTELRKMG